MSENKAEFTRADSIHPRVRKYGEKRNTCGNSSLVTRLRRQLRGIEKHLEQHPHDTASQTRVSRINLQLKDA